MIHVMRAFEREVKFFSPGLLANHPHVAVHGRLAEAQVLPDEHTDADTGHVKTVEELVHAFHLLKVGLSTPSVLALPNGGSARGEERVSIHCLLHVSYCILYIVSLT